MPEPESQQTKGLTAKILERLELLMPTADAQAVETDAPDTRALEGEDNLLVVGDQWEKQRERALLVGRILLLVALFGLVLVWLLSIGGLLLMVGYHVRGFSLSDAVVIAYMTTTTVSVIGLFKIAANWLFSDIDKPPKSK
ncbi:MAG TPA: hypothetical protein DC047_12485 [Blastocatellia bacterium]|nr:hypothetical protein [Blastocatellia bacterium]